MKQLNNETIRRIHFIGIGGIGVSSLAQYYLARDFTISGSDLADSLIIRQLRKAGAKIFIGPHKANNLPDHIDLVVYSAAVEKNNPEFLQARQKKIKCQTYAQALGDLTKKFFTIAVSGMHGKSTTTSMIALILVRAGLDPTVIVGAKLKEFGDRNFRLGKSRFLIIEADEYQASFLNYWPKIIALLNLEEEHLDYYKGLDHIMEVFKKYLSHLLGDGVLIANKDDDNVLKLRNSKFIQNSKFKIENFSLDQPEAKKLKKILKLPGEHNLSNALAALNVARFLNIPDKVSLEALAEFKGVWRRFEYKGQLKGAKIYDDYAHHPTEILATMKGARELLEKEKSRGSLSLIFQPHQYQRTWKLFNKFIKAFDQADNLIILPIYSVVGRENKAIKKKVSSEKLVKAVRARWKKINHPGRILFAPNFALAKKLLKDSLGKDDICIIMGAGDIWQLTEMLLK